MIPQDIIQEIIETSRIEEVIGEFVQLKKSGANYKGLSPFVQEKSPSFMVSPVKQIFKDFSSGKGGNVVSFIMEHEHYTYPEALRYLAGKYNIAIPEIERTAEDIAQANEKESIYLVSNYANEYFQKKMHETKEGKDIGLSYFHERGFTEETIKKFQLGYSPNEWGAFTKTAIKEGYKLEFLEKSGLSIVKEDKQFDRFKGRVMFPIHNLSGRVLGFGGRILTQDKKAAKYINSPESEIYHKSKVLYGLFYAKKGIVTNDNCMLVEGYTDVISMHQSGISNVVASSGTALTTEQIRLIGRYTKNITILFDGDSAGIRASFRGIDMILEQDMNVKVVLFPDGEDPDSYAKAHSTEELNQFLTDNSQDFIRFKTSMLVEETKNDPIKRAGLIKDIVTSISKIPDHIKRSVYLQECSSLLNIDEASLITELNKTKRKQCVIQYFLNQLHVILKFFDRVYPLIIF